MGQLFQVKEHQLKPELDVLTPFYNSVRFDPRALSHQTTKPRAKLLEVGRTTRKKQQTNGHHN